LPICWRLPLLPRALSGGFCKRLKSQNDEEDRFLAKLGEIIGDRPWVLVADRGFGRAELFRLLDERGIRYVIRVSGCAWIEHPWFTGPIDRIPRRPGRGYRYGNVLYRKKAPVPANLVVRHKEPAPAPWYLVTNLDASAGQVAKYYAQRMGIEQCIRDQKSGLGLKHLELCEPERMDRAMLLLAVVLLLLALTATACVARGRDLQLSTQRRKGTTLSFFTSGLRTLEQHPHLLSTKRRFLYAL